MSRVLSRPEWTQYVHQGIGFGFGLGFSAVASQFNITQLYNPVNSGKRLVVFLAEQSASTASNFGMLQDNTTLATPTGQAPVNMLFGSPFPSVATLGTAQATATPTTGLLIRRTSVAANTKDEVAAPYSVCEIPEGFGLDLVTLTANVSSSVGIWWAEVPTGSYA